MTFNAMTTLRLYAMPLILVVVDQVSKMMMLEMIFFPPKVVNLLPFLNLTPVWNKGISFGMLGNAGIWASIMLTIFAFGVGLILPYIAQQWDRVSRFGAMMMAGGAIGNAIDRTIHGKVIDFIDFFVGQWHWPAFNVADIAIVIGAGLILLGSVLSGQSSDKDAN